MAKLEVPEKWIAGRPDDQVSDVAKCSLQNRLSAVAQLLPLAAKRAEKDPEYIHQLRVWTRRASAAMSLFEYLMPRRRFKWMKKQLKRVRRAANDARDCDVLIERLSKEFAGRGQKRWLKELRVERVKTQKAVVEVYQWLKQDGRFERKIEKLLQQVKMRNTDTCAALPPFGDWARERLRGQVTRFFEAVPSDSADEAALHELRIRSKHLRYTMELVAGAFPEELKNRIYPTILAIQDQAGEINDLLVAKTRLREKLEVASDASEAKSWRQMLDDKQAQSEELRYTFLQSCNSQILQELRRGFEAMLGKVCESHETSNGVASKKHPSATQAASSRKCARQ